MTLELSAALLGSIPNTLGEEDTSSGLGSMGNYLDLPPATGGLIQFFVVLKLLNYSTGQLSPKGESRT